VALDESQLDAQLQSVATKLRTARFAQGLRLIDVANVSGLSEVHLYRLEQGERVPSLRALLVLAAALGLEPAELLARDDDGQPHRIAAHTGRAVWHGTEQSGSGEMSKGGVKVQYDLAHRNDPLAAGGTEGGTEGATVGSPESLLGMAFAGCFSMSLAADIAEAGFEPVRIETFAQVRTEISGTGVALTDIELRCEAAAPALADSQFQALAENAKRNCLVARALAAVPARLDARLVPIGEADRLDEGSDAAR